MREQLSIEEDAADLRDQAKEEAFERRWEEAVNEIDTRSIHPKKSLDEAFDDSPRGPFRSDSSHSPWKPTRLSPKVPYCAPSISLPTDAQERKRTPIFSGVLMYFPDAIAAVAQCSWAGNEQHNPGTKLHWDRAKSGDEHDAMLRHAMEAGTIDSDGIRHSAKVAWRALAALQKEIEQCRSADSSA